MLRESRWSVASAGALIAICLYAGQASAAQVSSITWNVTGGTFNGYFATGPIYSGVLRYTPPGGIAITPTTALEGGTWSLSLQGTLFGDGFRATVTQTNRVTIHPGGVILRQSPVFLVSGPLTNISCCRTTVGSSMYYGHIANLSEGPTIPIASVSNGIGVGSVRGSARFFVLGGHFNHFYTLGNEVRTIVPPEVPPEVPTGVPVWLLALVLAGAAAGSGPAALLRRKRRDAARHPSSAGFSRP